MQFGWLNLTGVLIIVLLMIPNLIYARRNPHMENKCACKPMLILEQIGRYGSMAMMVFPLFVWEFGFRSPEALVIWMVLLPALLLAYFAFWTAYFRRPSLNAALWLAVLPGVIFILRGIFLRHWLLTAFGVVFAVGHIYMLGITIGGREQTMSKYEPLWKAIGERTEDSFTLTYGEIEEILGIPIDHAFLTFKKKLPACGYEVGKISMKAQTVAFKRCV